MKMKKRIINLLFLGVLSCSLIISPMPIYAEETTTESSETIEEVKTPSTLKIEAYNKTKGNYESSVSFKVIDRQTGNSVSFSKESTGVYKAEPNGYYNYLESNGGFIEVTGLNGSYTIEDTGNNSNLYCNSSSNNLSIYDAETKSISFEYVQNYGSMTVTVLSEDDSTIADAKFILRDYNGSTVYFNTDGGVYVYASSGSSELSTNAAGKMLLNQLPAGTYTLEQTSAPVVYNGELIKKTVTIENQKELNISVTNIKEYGDLTVSISDDSDSSKNLSGSQFNIKNNNGEFVYVTMNTEGSYSFSRTSNETTMTASNGNLSISGLPEGSYILTESAPPSGYNGTEAKNFDIIKNNMTNIKVTNRKSVGSISISIKDEETKEPIKGFVYQILSKDTEKPLHFKETNDGYSCTDSGETDITTNTDGKIVIKNITTGTYYLKQVSAASGYLLNLDDAEQVVSTDLETVYETTASKSNSAVIVENSDGGLVENVSFEITDSNGNLIISDKTNENGKFLISGIEAGNYTLKITKVPETYSKYTKTVEFSINEAGLSQGLGKITIQYNKCTINLGKPDIAVVLSCEKDSSKVILKTDADGIVTFSKLIYGDYTITLEDETISFKPIQLSVTEEYDNLTYNVELVNETSIPKKTQDEETTVTKKVNNNIIIVIIALILVTSLGVYLFIQNKKKKQKKDDEDIEEALREKAEAEKEKVHIAYDDDGNAVIYEDVEVEEQNQETSDEEELNDILDEISNNNKSESSVEYADEEQYEDADEDFDDSEYDELETIDEDFDNSNCDNTELDTSNEQATGEEDKIIENENIEDSYILKEEVDSPLDIDSSFEQDLSKNVTEILENENNIDELSDENLEEPQNEIIKNSDKPNNKPNYNKNKRKKTRRRRR